MLLPLCSLTINILPLIFSCLFYIISCLYLNNFIDNCICGIIH
jgi:hypothetical protein